MGIIAAGTAGGEVGTMYTVEEEGEENAACIRPGEKVGGQSETIILTTNT